MYKLSVPISAETLTEESMAQFGRFLTACKVERVFLCCVGELYRTDCMPIAQPEKLRGMIRWLQSLHLLR